MVETFEAEVNFQFNQRFIEMARAFDVLLEML